MDSKITKELKELKRNYLRDLELLKEEFIDDISEDISKLENNPDIKFITNNTFTIKLSDINDILTPKYHNFNFIINTLTTILEERGPEYFISRIKTITNNRIYLNNKYYLIHPSLIKQLNTLFKIYL